MTAAEVLAGARFVDGLLVDQRSGNWFERPEPTGGGRGSLIAAAVIVLVVVIVVVLHLAGVIGPGIY